MRKIKFKTEYVPVSDDAIDQHKDFGALMALYAAAPKPNWFKKFIQNKWTMFGGGLMTGAIVASMFWYNQTTSTVEEKIAQQKEVVSEQKAVSAEPNESTAFQTPQSDKETTNNLNNVASSSSKQEVDDEVGFNNKNTASVEKKSTVVVPEKQVATDKVQPKNKKVAPENEEEIKTTATAVNNQLTPVNKSPEISTGISDQNFLEKELIDPIPVSERVALIALSQNNEERISVRNKIVPDFSKNSALAFSDSNENKTRKSNTDKNQGKKEKAKSEAAPSHDTLSHAFLDIKWPLFSKRNVAGDSLKSNKEKDVVALKNDSSEKSWDTLAATESFLPRYAQVSFVTPLSSNGIDGYKYMHYFSLNVLQGYNGALKGVEFGGLLNGDKGYVTGAQFGGLSNYAGGDLKGAQFGGLANVSKSVTGAQFAGIANISGTFVSGFQAAGIVNVAPDSLTGAQAAGVLNVLSSTRKSSAWQVAGVGNVSLGESKGGQIAGVFNLANHLDGVQIGLINVGKEVKGFQIGLINISDSISGVPIGLISVSKHGTFDVNGWTSDFLTFNGGLRVGSKYVYNIYAYGVSPFSTDLPFGFGIGIGGHIPMNKVSIDIDGMTWSMHKSYMSFYGVNLINQLRVMGGYTFNKYISIFAGPTLNVAVQNNTYSAFNTYHFYEHTGETNTVNIWPGFVAGIRLF